MEPEEVYKQLLEEVFTEIVFQVEIELQFEQSIQAQLKKYIQEDKLPLNSFDIFNNANSKEANECVCPNCSRTLGALRFAPHLEKCVGMGRSSSRIANRRILASSNSGKEGRYSEEVSDGNGGSQNSNGGGEWVPPKVTKRIDARRRKDRNGKHCKNKKKLEEVMAGVEDGEDCRYSNMSYEQRQTILAQVCGVVSEHTGKLCTRSVRCPKHSDEQRNNVRLAVLPNGVQSEFSKMSLQEKPIEDMEILMEIDQDSNSPVKKPERNYRWK